MSRHRTRLRGMPNQSHISHLAALDSSIYSLTCSYCGSAPGELCTSTPMSKHITLRAHTSTPHMARVREGSMILTKKELPC